MPRTVSMSSSLSSRAGREELISSDTVSGSIPCRNCTQSVRLPSLVLWAARIRAPWAMLVVMRRMAWEASVWVIAARAAVAAVVAEDPGK